DKYEEINLIVKGGNYGWSVREGFHPFKEQPHPNVELRDPVMEYAHNSQLETKYPHTPGASVTGGYVYRGKRIPALRGVYLYADYALGTVWGLRHENGRIIEHDVLLTQPRNISSLGEDSEGELYVVAFDSQIYELEQVAAE